MIDLRYLALTVISVFLALAVGLMIGSALGSPDRRDAAYENLRGQFELLRTENQRVQDQNDVVRRTITSREQAVRELLPLAVRGRLSGSVIGVVLCGSWDERRFWSELETALTLAGAEIGPVARIPDRLRPLSDDQRRRLGLYWTPELVGAEPPSFEVAGWVVRAMAEGGQRERLDEAARETGIELRGDWDTPVRRLLVLTNVADELRGLAVNAGEVPEVRVVDAAREQGLRVVAAEPEETVGSAVDPLRRRNIPTVDNIDTASGQISAILALAGVDGSFGSKPGAGRAIPALEPQ